MRRNALLIAAALVLPTPALAVFSGDMSPRMESSDRDYALGVRAWVDMDWPAMVEHLDKVVARRPWHDNAHTLLGYAHRRMGDYEAAFRHYDAALERNPNHRGALTYMGIAYLHLDNLPAAERTLSRLGEICAGMMLTFTDGDFGTGCEEFSELHDAIGLYRRTGEVVDLCPKVGRPDDV